jgi:hemerythrin-like domain-containing protein
VTRTQNPIEDEKLARTVADLVVQLRRRPYGDVLGRVEEAFRGSAEAFVDSLAQHLRHEEDVLFPALRKRDPATAREVDDLQAEHAVLRRLATGLARAIATNENAKACGVARTFLAELYAHIDRESKLTGPFES